jgi:hypothetical protein
MRPTTTRGVVVAEMLLGAIDICVGIWVKWFSDCQSFVICRAFNNRVSQTFQFAASTWAPTSTWTSSSWGRSWEQRCECPLGSRSAQVGLGAVISWHKRNWERIGHQVGIKLDVRSWGEARFDIQLGSRTISCPNFNASWGRSWTQVGPQIGMSGTA